MIARFFKDRRETGDTTLRKCQLVQLHLLYVIDDICKRNDIQYCLAYGSLLGAIRHNGFIPWDDDLDVWMPQSDYRKFLQIANKELPDDVMLHLPELTPRVSIPFAKIRDRYSYCGEPTQGLTNQDPTGIFIDIFPLERGPALSSRLFGFFLLCVSSPWNRKRWFLNHAANGLISAMVCVPMAILSQIVYVMGKVIWKVLTWFSPSENWCTMPEVGDRAVYKEKDLFPFINHEFEDGTFPVPANSDAVLCAYYGTWRQIPPEDERPRHATIIDPFHSVNTRFSMEYDRRCDC